MKKVDHAPSKRFKEAQKLIDADKTYSIEEAVDLAKKTSNVKFDAGVEVHINLDIDPKKADQQVRHSITLPHGTGKTIKIAVFTTNGDKQKEAKKAGADIVGDDDIITSIKAGKIDFDVLIATPDSMKVLAPTAKVLGPRGLMPNPKDGTVTQNVADAVAELKKGKINFKNDDSGNLHITAGKVSFENAQLQENVETLIEYIKRNKPSGVKGTFIKSITLTTSMGPGIKLAI